MWGAYACKVFPACIVFSVDIFRGKTLPESRTPSLATTYDLQVLDAYERMQLCLCNLTNLAQTPPKSHIAIQPYLTNSACLLKIQIGRILQSSFADTGYTGVLVHGGALFDI